MKRILFISDFHYCQDSYGEISIDEKAIRLVNQINRTTGNKESLLWQLNFTSSRKSCHRTGRRFRSSGKFLCFCRLHRHLNGGLSPSGRLLAVKWKYWCSQWLKDHPAGGCKQLSIFILLQIGLVCPIPTRWVETDFNTPLFCKRRHGEWRIRQRTRIFSPLRLLKPANYWLAAVTVTMCPYKL